MVMAVSPKLPAFWPQCPLAWFVHADKQFALSGITSESTKLSHIMGQLDAETIKENSDLFTNVDFVPGDLKKFKDEMIRRYTPSSSELLDKLSAIELGDMQPSKLLLKIRQLAGNIYPEHFIFDTWLKKLPSNVFQSICAVSDPSSHNDIQTNNNLALRANCCLLAPTIPPIVASSQASLSQSPLSQPQMTNAVHSFRRAQPNRQICFYHRKFGQRARNCVAPCSYIPKNTLLGQQ